MALKKSGFNEARNPLFHDASETCYCVLCQFKDVPNLVLWAKKEIEAGRVHSAHARLDGVRGVGGKIASFFLRDVADYYEIKPNRDRYLLQPVDVWVRRAVAALGGPDATDEMVQNWVCKHSERPERANQSMWYFGSQVAGSNYVLSKAIGDIEYAKKLLRETIEDSGAEIAASDI